MTDTINYDCVNPRHDKTCRFKSEDCERGMTNGEVKQIRAERDEAIRILRGWIAPGGTVVKSAPETLEFLTRIEKEKTSEEELGPDDYAVRP